MRCGRCAGAHTTISCVQSAPVKCNNSVHAGRNSDHSSFCSDCHSSLSVNSHIRTRTAAIYSVCNSSSTDSVSTPLILPTTYVPAAISLPLFPIYVVSTMCRFFVSWKLVFLILMCLRSLLSFRLGSNFLHSSRSFFIECIGCGIGIVYKNYLFLLFSVIPPLFLHSSFSPFFSVLSQPKLCVIIV